VSNDLTVTPDRVGRFETVIFFGHFFRRTQQDPLNPAVSAFVECAEGIFFILGLGGGLILREKR
jgi:hypothetical protein